MPALRKYLWVVLLAQADGVAAGLWVQQSVLCHPSGESAEERAWSELELAGAQFLRENSGNVLDWASTTATEEPTMESHAALRRLRDGAGAGEQQHVIDALERAVDRPCRPSAFELAGV